MLASERKRPVPFTLAVAACLLLSGLPILAHSDSTVTAGVTSSHPLAPASTGDSAALTESRNTAGGAATVASRPRTRTGRPTTLKPAVAAEGTYTTVDYPRKQNTAANAINDRGDIVGFFEDADHTPRGFLLSGGQYTSLDYPGAGVKATVANGINNRGEIVGYYRDGRGTHGFRYKDGNWTSVVIAGATYTEVNGINDRGEIVGGYGDGFAKHGFVQRGDELPTNVDYPGADVTAAWGINNRGQIVGYFEANKNRQGFLLGPRGYVPFGYAGSISTQALHINDQGLIVGSYKDNYTDHGFWGTAGHMIPMNHPNSSRTFATGINTQGTIVGYWYDENGMPHGFMYR